MQLYAFLYSIYHSYGESGLTLCLDVHCQQEKDEHMNPLPLMIPWATLVTTAHSGTYLKTQAIYVNGQAVATWRLEDCCLLCVAIYRSYQITSMACKKVIHNTVTHGMIYHFECSGLCRKRTQVDLGGSSLSTIIMMVDNITYCYYFY